MEIEEIPIEEIVRRFVSQESQWHKKEDHVYHASSVWQCFRKAFYEWKGIPEERPPPKGLFEMGRRVEAIVFDALKLHYGERFVINNIPVRLEIFNPCENRAEHLPLANGYCAICGQFIIIGETDPVIMNWNMKYKTLLEIKSSYKGKDAKPGPHQMRQAVFYAGVLGIDDVRIVMPSRNDVLDISVHHLSASEIGPLFKDVQEYFTVLDRYLRNDKLPPAIPLQPNECGYCPFLQKCRTDGGWVKKGNRWSRIGAGEVEDAQVPTFSL